MGLIVFRDDNIDGIVGINVMMGIVGMNGMLV